MIRVPHRVFARAVLALVILPAGLMSAQTVTGRWLLDFDTDSSIQLTLKQRESGHGNWSSSDDYRLEDFRGLVRPQGSADVPATFEMVRDAGTIRFEGQLN